MEESVEADPWLAPDKLQHLLFCFSLTLLISLVASRSRYAFIRSRNVLLGSFLSLSAGAAKELADHLEFFRSAGASSKDAVADAVGVLIACLVLSLCRFRSRLAKSVRRCAVISFNLYSVKRFAQITLSSYLPLSSIMEDMFPIVLINLALLQNISSNSRGKLVRGGIFNAAG